jgi:hypothetical protein
MQVNMGIYYVFVFGNIGHKLCILTYEFIYSRTSVYIQIDNFLQRLKAALVILRVTGFINFVHSLEF